MLCSNRTSLPGSPSTCVLDIGIIPFPSAVLVLVFFLYLIQRVRKNRASAARLDQQPPSCSASRVFPAWVHYIYVALIVALFGMRILEIIRLAAARMGVGLLPLGLVATVVLLFVICYNNRNFGFGPARSFHVSFMLVFYWFISAIFVGIKVTRLRTQDEVDPKKGSAYPSSDWLLDNAVILGLNILFIIVEGIHLAIAYQRGQRPLYDGKVTNPLLGK